MPQSRSSWHLRKIEGGTYLAGISAGGYPLFSDDVFRAIPFPSERAAVAEALNLRVRAPNGFELKLEICTSD